MYQLKLGSEAISISLPNGNVVWRSATTSDQSNQWITAISAGTLREALETLSYLPNFPTQLTNLWLREVYRAKCDLKPR